MTRRPDPEVSYLELQFRDFIKSQMIIDDRTQRQLAKEIGLTHHTISRILTGFSRMSFINAERLLTALGYRATIQFEKIKR